MKLKQKDIEKALRTVEDPDLHRDLVSLNMVKGIELKGDRVHVHIELTTPACPMKDRIEQDIVHAIERKSREKSSSVPEVTVRFTADVRKPQEKQSANGNPLPQVKHVIAVGAGKGGVGKSSIAINLAVGLARHGAAAGLLDADIYGPSSPTMLGLHDHRPAMRDEKTLVPFKAHGIHAMTIGKLVEPDKPLIWRGPMAHGAFRQLALQTDWPELDYLIVDLPPGTGDVPLTLTQLLPLTGAVVVCTPQQVAQDDARRAVRMFQQLGVSILGVVENMSHFVGDDGKEYDLFGRGGAEDLASAMNLPFIGAIPIHMKLRENADAGTPLLNWEVDPTLTQALERMCEQLASQISIAAMSGDLVQPTVSIR